LAAERQPHRATSRRGRALPGRVGRAALLAVAFLCAAGPASAEEVFTSQAAAANATDSTWIPAPPRRAAVCIVDTGTDITPDTTNVVARFSMDDSDGSDISPVKHGTLMATIASAPKNDFGMVGAAPSIDIVSIRASRDGVSFTGLDLQAAVQLCVKKRSAYNIKVVSLSLGGDGGVVAASTKQRNEFQDAIDNARAYGLNVVAAAGNNERGVVDWPAGYPSSFAVAAATDRGERCSFASWGPEVDLWASGCPLDVARADATGRPAWASGSSEATAFVAAVLAQMRGLNMALDVDAAEQAFRTSARDFGCGPYIDVGGAFRVAGLTTAIAAGHEAVSAPAVVVPLSAGIEPQPVNSETPGPAGFDADVQPVASPKPPITGSPSVIVPNQTRPHLGRPVVRAATVMRGRLILSVSGRLSAVDAWVDIYARKHGKSFPSVVRQVRFRGDTLRIRVSGAISQVSIGYRDPTGVRGQSEVIVVHPRTNSRRFRSNG
jgi:hypothetical protein